VVEGVIQISGPKGSDFGTLSLGCCRGAAFLARPPPGLATSGFRFFDFPATGKETGKEGWRGGRQRPFGRMGTPKH